MSVSPPVRDVSVAEDVLVLAPPISDETAADSESHSSLHETASTTDVAGFENTVAGKQSMRSKDPSMYTGPISLHKGTRSLHTGTPSLNKSTPSLRTGTPSLHAGEPLTNIHPPRPLTPSPVSEAANRSDAAESLKSNLPKLLAPVSASVPRCYLSNETYCFVIECQMEDGKFWELTRYYADFCGLQIRLLDMFPEEAGKYGLPRTLPFMPGPVVHIADAISNGRRANLDEYIRKLVAMPPHISQSVPVCILFAPRHGDVESEPIGSPKDRKSGPPRTPVERVLRKNSYSKAATPVRKSTIAKASDMSEKETKLRRAFSFEKAESDLLPVVADSNTAKQQHIVPQEKPALTQQVTAESSTKAANMQDLLRTCDVCHEELTGQFVRALGGTYHLECFTCRVSQSPALTVNSCISDMLDRTVA